MQQMVQRRMRVGIAGVLASFIWMTLLPPAAHAEGESAKPEHLVFKQTEDAKGNAVELRLHVFKPEGWSKDDKRPAIVFFFGGGWVAGSPAQFYPQSRELAERGMVAISAEYRIKNKHGTSPLACVSRSASMTGSSSST